MTWGRYRRGRLRRSKFQRVREGTNLGQAGGTGSGPRAGIFRCESCRCSSSGARREQLRLLLDVNPSLLDSLPEQARSLSANVFGHRPCRHQPSISGLTGSCQQCTKPVNIEHCPDFESYDISKTIRIIFLAVWNQRSLLVRGRRHHPNHYLLHPLHHAQDQGSWGQDFPTGEILQREREENKNRDFCVNMVVKHHFRA